MPTSFSFAPPTRNSRMEEQRQAMNDPLRRRQLAEQVVHALGLKLKTRNLNAADEWRVICPLHQEKTPQGSCYISPEKFVYHCFSCQESGSLSSLYYRLTSRSFYKDFNIVNDEFTAFSFDSPYAVTDYSIIDPNIRIQIRGAIVPAHKHPESIKYLRARGIPFDIAESMRMGFMNHGYINGTTFSKRLTIPVYEGSRLLAVEGRDVTGTQLKVLYPKDSMVATIYDVDTLSRSDPLYVVEGLTKLAVLRSDPYFKNSTATFGAGLGDRQLWLLSQFDRVIMIPDKDDAGKKSLRKLKENFGKPFEILEIPSIGDIKDVGDIPTQLHTTVEALRKRGWGRVLKSSSDLVFY